MHPSWNLRRLATSGEIGNLQSSGPGLRAFADSSGGPNVAAPHNHANGDGDKERGKKTKKTKDIQMTVAGKIAMLSGKHTEIMSLDARVKDCEKLSLDSYLESEGWTQTLSVNFPAWVFRV